VSNIGFLNFIIEEIHLLYFSNCLSSTTHLQSNATKRFEMLNFLSCYVNRKEAGKTGFLLV
jgi:hypothetical protein